MTSAVTTLSSLLHVACGREPIERGRARRMQLMITAGLASLLFSALWGVAAGSTAPALAAANAYKVPMVVLLSVLFAAPAGVLALRLSAAPIKTSDMLVALGSAIFSGTLVLAVLSPVVALYYHTSNFAGPFLAMGSAGIALVVSVLLFARSCVHAKVDAPPAQYPLLAIPLAVTAVIQVASLIQLIALASPILPELTMFEAGVDHVVGR
jgi:hypothetical protein